jgi:uncharacterized coiled-coil DUF342 family protein
MLMPIELDMSIEETIEHLDRIANNQFECADRIDELHCDSTSTRNMASYHKRLAEWLRELKDYKDRQDLINKSWQELINYKEGIEKIKMRIQSYRECGETVLASGMEQALDILMEVNADEDSD